MSNIHVVCQGCRANHSISTTLTCDACKGGLDICKPDYMPPDGHGRVLCQICKSSLVACIQQMINDEITSFLNDEVSVSA
jgi:hypothetical protein